MRPILMIYAPDGCGIIAPADPQKNTMPSICLAWWDSLWRNRRKGEFWRIYSSVYSPLRGAHHRGKLRRICSPFYSPLRGARVIGAIAANSSLWRASSGQITANIFAGLFAPT
jgi:hypothetical protein